MVVSTGTVATAVGTVGVTAVGSAAASSLTYQASQSGGGDSGQTCGSNSNQNSNGNKYNGNIIWRHGRTPMELKLRDITGRDRMGNIIIIYSNKA